MTAAFLGVDIGTSGCKSLLLSSAGKVLGTETVAYDFQQPRPGWSEQDPKVWRAGARDTVRKLLQKVNADIQCIGLSGQMHGMTALDAAHRVIRPAILWNDQRNEEECDQITESAGGIAELAKLTGNRMLPGFTGGKILWHRRHEPELFEQTRLILNPKDYLRLVLTGEIATEVSDASGTGLFDVGKRQWCGKLIEQIGLDQTLLAPVAESIEVTGRITDAAAEEFGLQAGIPVIGGGGDAVIQTLGSGVYRPGTLQTTIGTAGIVATMLKAPIENSEGRVQISCNVLPETWHCMGVSLNAGSALQWWRATHSGYDTDQPQFEAMAQSAAAIPAGAEGLIFLPYLMGERCPWPDPHASGAFVGLRSHHRLAHFHRAVFEGIIFSLRDMASQVSPGKRAGAETVHTSGGGAASPFWNQMQADIFGVRTVVTQYASHGAAFGAALLAGIAHGNWSVADDLDNIRASETEWRPRPELVDRYDRYFAIYSALYSALHDVSQRLAGLLIEENRQ